MNRAAWTWSAGLVAVGLSAHAVLSVDWATADPVARSQAMVARGTGPNRAVPTVPAAPAPLRTAEMPCFDCHSHERWQTETRFNHPQHAGAGHCHSCHAFEGHFQVTIRQEHCDVCHKAGGQAAPLKGEDTPF